MLFIPRTLLDKRIGIQVANVLFQSKILWGLEHKLLTFSRRINYKKNYNARHWNIHPGQTTWKKYNPNPVLTQYRLQEEIRCRESRYFYYRTVKLSVNLKWRMGNSVRSSILWRDSTPSSVGRTRGIPMGINGCITYNKFNNRCIVQNIVGFERIPQ